MKSMRRSTKSFCFGVAAASLIACTSSSSQVTFYTGNAPPPCHEAYNCDALYQDPAKYARCGWCTLDSKAYECDTPSCYSPKYSHSSCYYSQSSYSMAGAPWIRPQDAWTQCPVYQSGYTTPVGWTIDDLYYEIDNLAHYSDVGRLTQKIRNLNAENAELRRRLNDALVVRGWL